MRKTILSLAVAAAVAVPAVATAQSAPSPLTGNASLFTNYIFRGVTQTGGKPAMQGGADYAASSGLYVGTWLSNVSVLEDFGIAKESSLEWDFYGGYKGSVGDFGYDLGMLQYYYPGLRVPGAVTANTREVYGALSWKWVSAKYSRSVTDRTFAVQDSKGTYYLDFTVTVPVSEKFSAVAHYGIQKFSGNAGLACGNNDTCASYKDWKLGGSYAMKDAWTLGAYVTGTRMTAVQELNYTVNGRDLGKTAVTAYLTKTF
jgi:uncharacterized protein (TIGR02001 family)